MQDDFEFAPGFKASAWRKLHLDPTTPHSADWVTGVEMFRTRIQKRFLDPVDVLIDAGKEQERETFGFAILAIDFLVLETLQGFRDGVANHKDKSKELICAFLTRWGAFKECLPANANAEAFAIKVYVGYRCALHHSGATDGNMLVGITGPTVRFGAGTQVKINRSRFHEELKRAFGIYVDELRNGKEPKLRSNFQTVMNAICN